MKKLLALLLLSPLAISSSPEGYSEKDCQFMLSENIKAYLICIQYYSELSRFEVDNKLSDEIDYIAPRLRKYHKEGQRALDALNNMEIDIEELKELAIINQLKNRCASYGFDGDSNISACIQREAQHDKEMAIQELELQRARVALQKAQSQSYVQPVAEVKAEEKLHWTVKFLGDIIKEYPEARAKAAREEAIRKSAYKKGERDGRNRCSGSANC